jgi:hypothetical protein
MPSPDLHSRLGDLASQFASDVLAALRSASLDELQAGNEMGNGRRARRGTTTAPRASAPKATKSGRLPRRSPEEIAKVLDHVVALVKKSKTGMRSEEIKKALNLDVREVPRLLREGIAKKKLTKKGEKRATIYSAR